MSGFDTPGEKLLGKIWDSLVENGVGGLLAPWQIKRVGLAKAEVRAEEMRLLAQAEKDAEEIRSGAVASDLLDRSSADSEQISFQSELQRDSQTYRDKSSPLLQMAEIARDQTSYKEIRRTINLIRVLAMAEEEAESIPDESVGDEKVDHDWFQYWREHAERVSAEDLQRLWARILTCEFQNPGSNNLRLLDFMSKLTHEEAKKIERIGPIISENIIFSEAAERHSDETISFSEALEMEEIGVLYGVDSNVLSFNLTNSAEGKFRGVIPIHQRAIVLEHEDPYIKTGFRAYGVTKIGCQVISLGDFSPNEIYMDEITRIAKAKGFSVRIGDWIPGPGPEGLAANLVDI